MIDSSIETGSTTVDRRDAARLTTVLPVLEIDGKFRHLLDCSAHGFRAELPERFRKIGVTATGILHFNAAGHSVHKTISFEVIHVLGAAVGVRFEVLHTKTEASGTLF
ncbi:hypothetical protein HH303_08670 [Rhodospirillaceae bacterium KN72]|uniref:PilZ domain-containing protein n=1 Tax=Pacificispira spongiicola TaxID=2729598 RepID=A0A7Y0E159_9PROT|nr:hypothetical protein [Pacificispira spongiicola]NMM44551.1 hypothetical protein [Pacificispira spongiicola]